MKIENISTTNLPGLELNNKEVQSKKDFMTEFWDVIEGINNTQKTGQQKMTDVMTGKSDDTHGALVALEKASLEFEIATTIRDKAVFAFNKLMDTQI